MDALEYNCLMPCSCSWVQVLQPGLTEKFLETRRKDQQRALERLRSDPALSRLKVGCQCAGRALLQLLLPACLASALVL